MNNIFLTQNAQFYRKKIENQHVANTKIQNIISEASKNKQSSAYIINDFRVSRTINDLSFNYTLRVFKSKKKVDFIMNENYYDTIHSFILLIEFDNYLVIFKKSTNTITSSVSEKYELMKYSDILNIASDEMTIQRVALRNMTISGEAIHSHSYETPGNLNGLLSLHSAGKSIPKNLKLKKDAVTKSLTASTGRIIESAERQNIDNVFLWSKTQIDIMTARRTNKFLEKFAQPVELNNVLNDSDPKAILIELYPIRERVDNNEIELVIYKEYEESKYKRIPYNSVKRIFKLLEKVYEFSIDRNSTTSEIIKSDIQDPEDDEYIGKLKINEKSLTFDIPLLKRIFIKDAERFITLQKYIIINKLYSIVFNDFKYMYFMGACFKDSSGVSEIDEILSILEPKTRINTVINEKGSVSTTHTKFDSTSMFDAVEDIHNNDDYIFCDDLGIEWCDHISLNTTTKKIHFIHSKAERTTSLSASKMHEVVGQGIKNLGNMRFPISDFKSIKENKFLEKYYKDGTQTQIERVRKGNLNTSDFDIINELINDYETHRECILSCSFLSKSDVEFEFNKIKNNEFVRGNIIQLFWIISSFMHACKGSNVIPKIYSKP